MQLLLVRALAVWRHNLNRAVGATRHGAAPHGKRAMEREERAP